MKTIIVTLSLMFSAHLFANDGQVHGVSFTPNEVGDRLVYAVESNIQQDRMQKVLEFTRLQLQLDQQGEHFYNLTECMEAFMVNMDAALADVCVVAVKN